MIGLVLTLMTGVAHAAVPAKVDAAKAVPAKVDLAKTTNAVEFLAVGTPSALKIRGKVADGKLAGNCAVEAAELKCTGTIPLDALDTGIDLRNRHMKEKYLETASHPEATVSVRVASLPEKVRQGEGTYEGKFDGTMKLHGVEKPVTGTAKIEASGGKLSGNFDFDFLLSDYGIAIPSYLGITVSKTVNVAVRFKE